MKTKSRFAPAILYAGFALSCVGCSDSFESHYASFSEAKKSGAVERGCIPTALTEKTFDIVEVHHADTNETWGSFQFPPRENSFGSAPIEATAADAQGGLTASDEKWWPSSLEVPFDEMKISQAGFKLFGDSTKEFYFAINHGEGKGYFWSVPR